eukprot:symbB.v1.2.033696.t1/scaffold4218.1/size80730/3
MFALALQPDHEPLNHAWHFWFAGSDLWSGLCCFDRRLCASTICREGCELAFLPYMRGGGGHCNRCGRCHALRRLARPVTGIG